MSFSHLVLVFTIFSFIGWLIESLWCCAGTKKLVNRGFLSGPWCPIYGFGSILLLLITNQFTLNPFIVFLVSLISTTLLEYFTGWLMETLFNSRWWDYSKRKFNFKGRVCLRNSIIFGFLGLAVVYILYPSICDLLIHVSEPIQRLVAQTIVVILFFDTIHAISAAAKLDEHLRVLREAIVLINKYEHDNHWFEANDIPGSIKKLSELCAAQPENEIAAKILAKINAQSKDHKVSRLLKAFPKLKSTHFHDELESLKNEWNTKHKKKQESATQAHSTIKEKRKIIWESIKASYEGITLTRMIWVFLIACVIGFVVETLFCLATNGHIESRQGMLYGPFSQIYGFGAVIMVLLLTPLAAKGDRWLFFGGALIGGLFEAGCSLIQEVCFGSVSWEYSHQQIGLFGGRTSLLYMLFWGILAVFYMKLIYPRLSSLVDRIPFKVKHSFTWLIVAILSADMILSAMAVGRWSNRIEGIAPKNQISVWLDEEYPNDKMAVIYPNMKFK